MGLVSQHPHIVTVFNAAFTTTKQPCIVMELYSGGTLGERLKREGPLPLAARARRRREDRRRPADGPRPRAAAPRHQAAEPVRLRVRRAGARRLRDLHARRRALDLRRRRADRPLRPAGGARGRAGDAALRRLLARRHAVHAARGRPPVRRRRPAPGSRSASWPGGSCSRTRRGSAAPDVPRSLADAARRRRWPSGRTTARRRRPRSARSCSGCRASSGCRSRALPGGRRGDVAGRRAGPGPTAVDRRRRRGTRPTAAPARPTTRTRATPSPSPVAGPQPAAASRSAAAGGEQPPHRDRHGGRRRRAAARGRRPVDRSPVTTTAATSRSQPRPRRPSCWTSIRRRRRACWSCRGPTPPRSSSRGRPSRAMEWSTRCVRRPATSPAAQHP